jgi:hypothetical protein
MRTCAVVNGSSSYEVEGGSRLPENVAEAHKHQLHERLFLDTRTRNVSAKPLSQRTQQL